MSSLSSPFPTGLGGDAGCPTYTAITLAGLTTRVRERADMVGSSFVSDATIYQWITEAHQKLHGMLVDALSEQYAYELSSFTTTFGQMDYALPSCFYKLYGVDMEINGRIVSLKPFTRAERNKYRNLDGNSSTPPMYSITGNLLKLFPVPPAGLSGEIIFAPQATRLELSTDEISYPNGWERFIVIDAAIQCLLKEESSVTGLVEERERIVREIEMTKEQRDLANPKRVTDVFEPDGYRNRWGDVDW